MGSLVGDDYADLLVEGAILVELSHRSTELVHNENERAFLGGGLPQRHEILARCGVDHVDIGVRVRADRSGERDLLAIW